MQQQVLGGVHSATFTSGAASSSAGQFAVGGGNVNDSQSSLQGFDSGKHISLWHFASMLSHPLDYPEHKN